MNFKITKPTFDVYEDTQELHSFLELNEKGRNIDVRTPLFNKASRNEIKSEWFHIINLNKSLLFDELYEDEIDQMSKIGRYSLMLPFHERFNDVKGYYTNLNSKINIYSSQDRLVSKTFDEMFNKYKRSKSKIRLKSLENLRYLIPMNTNSGLPFFDRRSKVFETTVKFIKDNFDNLDDLLDYQRCILGWRGQPIDKQRVIWMFTLALNLLESQYYVPNTKDAQLTYSKAEFISETKVEELVTNLFLSKGRDDDVMNTDFERADWRFNNSLQDISWEMKKFKLNANFNMINNQEKIHFRKFNIPIVCTNDIQFSGDHGMATGSSGTNTDENEAFEFMQTYCALANGSRLNKFSTRQGDDGLLTYPGISAKQVVEVYESIFGQKMNKDKQYISKTCTKYLQRLYCIDYTNNDGTMMGCYPTMRALGRLIAQERFKPPKFWNNEMVTLRSLSILENCNRHPLFENFVNFVIKGDKFELGIKIPGFLEKLTSYSYRDLFNDERLDLSYSKYLEYKANPDKGIKSWRILKYLMKLKNKSN